MQDQEPWRHVGRGHEIGQVLCKVVGWSLHEFSKKIGESGLERGCAAMLQMHRPKACKSRRCVRHERADHGWNNRISRWCRRPERTM
ncbi:hypothetical protein MA16_Dca004947 [Dendrobium catenatum]|uniref:Uncharacterized protein n=1 Tax=Dendrobium catenatum TaxID=906689 RepID=A0A2I0WGG5_9ASPA|nr:hypothetical protein MA16_Dca004947 [Dendrobium catenatum]